MPETDELLEKLETLLVFCRSGVSDDFRYVELPEADRDALVARVRELERALDGNEPEDEYRGRAELAVDLAQTRADTARLRDLVVRAVAPIQDRRWEFFCRGHPVDHYDTWLRDAAPYTGEGE